MKKAIYTLSVGLIMGYSTLGQEGNNSKSLNINTEFIEFAPTVSGDGKTMIFQSNREGAGFRIYESTLQSDNNWSSPIALDNINRIARPNYLIGGPCLSQDGKTLYFCAMTYLSYTDMDIFVSKKNSKNEWGNPTNIGRPINTTNSETFPSISPDGKKLFYTLTTVKGKEDKCTKIMMSELDAKKHWQKPVEVASPVNGSCDKSPRVAYDNKTLFFSSNKNGNYDLFHSEMSAPNTWSQPVALDYVNSPESELYISLDPSESLMYYSQKGDIYVTTVPDKFRIHGLGISGKFVDEESGESLSGKIFVIDTLAKDTLKRFDVKGSYNITLPAEKKYKVYATALAHYDYSATYSPTIAESFTTIVADIKLKFKKKEVVFKISDKENSKGLKVKIKVTNVVTKEETIVEANSGRDGKYAVSLKEGNKYNVEISSIEGYAFTNTTIEVPLSTSNSETLYAAGNVETDSAAVSDATIPNFDIQLQPLKDDTKLTLNDIHFLFNKFQLEEESYKELDRVVSLMKSNPTAQIEIAAHTDDIGSDNFNNNLSTKRAQEIVKYLNDKGIPSSRLFAKGYGKTRPLDPANTEEARAKNRRVELKILDIK
ncbi:MAG TPA: OmpA family protein [Cytophagaceae bacterium]|jgi:outer membrane protein OmpA-like peptidoglycan-associated protein|nr:OmpA family protein [Cytophagaceae bacterium]